MPYAARQVVKAHLDSTFVGLVAQDERIAAIAGPAADASATAASAKVPSGRAQHIKPGQMDEAVLQQ